MQSKPLQWSQKLRNKFAKSPNASEMQLQVALTSKVEVLDEEISWCRLLSFVYHVKIGYNCHFTYIFRYSSPSARVISRIISLLKKNSFLKLETSRIFRYRSFCQIKSATFLKCFWNIRRTVFSDTFLLLYCRMLVPHRTLYQHVFIFPWSVRTFQLFDQLELQVFFVRLFFLTTY